MVYTYGITDVWGYDREFCSDAKNFVAGTTHTVELHVKEVIAQTQNQTPY